MAYCLEGPEVYVGGFVGDGGNDANDRLSSCSYLEIATAGAARSSTAAIDMAD